MKIKAVLLCLVGFVFLSTTVDWGFFGHRRINRLACFTLPSDLFGFYKSNIDYVTAHAVDPDKRRYASKFEAIRHYIDLDQWGEAPFDAVPRDWTSVLMHYTSIERINRNGDTLSWLQHEDLPYSKKKKNKSFELQGVQIPYAAYRSFFRNEIMSSYYEDDRTIDKDSLLQFVDKYGVEVKDGKYIAVDHFSEHGVLPYHLKYMQSQLKKAFFEENVPRILRLSAEMGHYLGDAHVPLHTTKNYNGQLTDQLGIHGFWESRIPELFADEEYDYFVGKANYIEDKQAYFWDVVLKSHSLVDSVLLIEKELSKSFAQDQQYCYDDRGNVLTRTYCKEYARAYSERMGGMVEERMRNAILAIGSSWYTAWVDAGQPDLPGFGVDEQEIKTKEDLEVEKAFEAKKIKGRQHDQ